MMLLALRSQQRVSKIVLAKNTPSISVAMSSFNQLSQLRISSATNTRNAVGPAIVDHSLRSMNELGFYSGGTASGAQIYIQY